MKLPKSCIFWLILFTWFLSESGFAQQAQQDCYRALSICNTSYSSNVVYPGAGAVLDVPLNSTCIPTGEQNSSWFQFNVISGGTFNFQLQPNSASDDYDFILFNISNDSCSSIADGSLPPVRCNFSSTPGATGLQAGAVGTSIAASGSPQCAQLAVTTGQVYVLLVNNYTASQNGYELQISGSASVVDNIVPQLDTVTFGTICNPKSVRLILSEPILCSTISSDMSEFSISGPSVVSLTSVAGVGCGTQGQTNTITLTFLTNILVPGTYTISVQNGSDGNTFGDGCQNFLASNGSITFEIEHIGPTVTLVSSTNTSCGGNTGAIDIDVTGGTAPFTYLWNTNPNQTTQDISNLGSRGYSVTVTDANGCTAALSRTITQLNSPTLTVAQNNPVLCNGANDGSATVNATGGTPPYTFSWNTTPIQTSSTAINLSPGNHQVTVTDDVGCSRLLNVNTTQPTPINVGISYNNTDCGGAIGDASATVSGGVAPYTYSWNTVPVQTTASISQLTAGAYELTVLDANNCPNVQTVTIQSAVNLGAAIANVRGTCDEPSGRATATTNNANPPYTYEWNTVPPQFSATATNLPEGSSYVIVTDASGCTQVINVKIDTLIDVTATIVSSTLASCGESDGQITAGSIGGLGPYTFQWQTNPVVNNATLSGLTFGFFDVIVTDANTCNDTLTFELKEFRGTADFEWNEGCYGTPTTFEAIANSEVDTFAWNFGSPTGGLTNFDTGSVVTYTYPAIASYTVSLIANGRCISDTITKIFTINNVPVPNFQVGYDTIFNNSTLPFIYTGTPVVQYFWDFGNGLTGTGPHPFSYYRDSGFYDITLIAIDSNGCSDTITESIYVFDQPLIYLPNAFTPETGRLNDYFLVVGRGVAELNLEIFNRWGEVVYQTSSVTEAMTKGWDGTFKGLRMPQGVYGYQIEVKFINNRLYSRTGTITMIR